MNPVHGAVDRAIIEIDQLRRNLKKNKTRQINFEERSIIKAVALTWFHNYRSIVENNISAESLKYLDDLYKSILSAGDKASSREKCDKTLKFVRGVLSKTRCETVVSQIYSKLQTADESPQFAPLISDPLMQDVLKRRWEECRKCLFAGAPLASVVMMGGLLEAILLAKVNKEPDKSQIFKAKMAPVNPKTGKVLMLAEWTLRHYIDVAHELKWIPQSAKDVGVVLRDYRNYIHPYKELAHNVILGEDDAKLLWDIVKNMTRQIIKSSTT